MKFASFALLFLSASSAVSAKEDQLQQKLQQKSNNHHLLPDVHSSATGKEGHKNIRGGLVSGEIINNNNNNNNRSYNDNDVDGDAIADVGILSLNSNNYGSHRDLPQSCMDCCVGDSACSNAGSATIEDNSCNGFSACVAAGYTGSAIIGTDSCNGKIACNNLSPSKPYSVEIGNESCNGYYACRRQGEFGDVTIGYGSCLGDYSCVNFLIGFPAGTPPSPITIGNNACTCAGCCRNILPGSVVGNNKCTSLSKGCAYTLVGALPDCSNFVCEFNPKLVTICNGGNTQCIPRKAAEALLKANDGNKCGPC